MEENLYINLGNYWDDNKRVSRAVLFQTVLDIDQMFNAANGPDGKGTI